VIRAPFSGVVTAKRAFVGEAVSPFGSSPSGGGSGGAIVTLIEFSSLYVGADVNEANLSKLAPKQPAEITLDAVPTRRITAFSGRSYRRRTGRRRRCG
jgi:multidrug resistance efflux pump